VAKRSAGGASKSEAIRSYKRSHDNAGPTAIAEALSKDGTKVTPAFVSTVLSNDRRRSRRGRRPGVHRGRRSSGDPLESLVQAKRLADRMGGIDKARAALDALARILG
jgi:hypothetical protein